MPLSYLALIMAVAARMTHPMPGKSKPFEPLDVTPADQVPASPESFVWKVVPKTKGATAARIVVTGYNRSPLTVGTIPAGSELSLTQTSVIGRIHFYAVPVEQLKIESTIRFPADTTYWISGLDLKATAKKPAGQ